MTAAKEKLFCSPPRVKVEVLSLNMSKGRFQLGVRKREPGCFITALGWGWHLLTGGFLEEQPSLMDKTAPAKPEGGEGKHKYPRSLLALCARMYRISLP